ncbi:MAG TPA: OmpW family outer membrane protein [Steroidobacteraceae bacterium]|nr:OmpW family outer membrane protein [Steroidobacteraceae bacterium]
MPKSIIRALPTALAAVAVSLWCSATALADDGVPSNDFRIGSYTVFYHASATDLQGPFVPPGLNFDPENLETLYLGYVRRLNPHFNFELALGLPPVAKVKGSGPAYPGGGSIPYNGQVLSSVRWFAPTALIEYNFFGESAPVRPFIGIGINYTYFYDRDSTPAGDAISGGPTKISLPSSIGPAATIGVTWRPAPHWDLNASYSASKVNARLTADTAGEIRTSHIEFNPQALILSVGYAF